MNKLLLCAGTIGAFFLDGSGGAQAAGQTRSPVRVEVVSVTRSSDDVLVRASVTNTGNVDMCFLADQFDKPFSAVVGIGVRFSGRQLRRPPEGYLMPQKPGFVTVRPSESVSTDFQLAGRFHPPIERLIRSRRWQVRVGIVGAPCTATRIGSYFTTWSPWTPSQAVCHIAPFRPD